jgi:hypothetical protein
MHRIAILILAALPAAAQIRWTHLSSANGDLPVPAGSHQQTGSLIADIDRDGAADFLLSFRVKAPALVWYRRTPTGWTQYTVETEFLTLEAGGAAFDIDADGDLDVVFGADSQNRHLWWWENPFPHFDPAKPWTRRAIKNFGANQHHDQIFADFTASGRPQLAFWNQKAKSLFLAPIPDTPRETSPWPLQEIFSGSAGEGRAQAALYAEGIDAFDIDGDRKPDLLAGNYWFKHQGPANFRPVQIAPTGGRIRAGRFIEKSKVPQVVIAPGDGSGPLTFHTCRANPADPQCWQSRDLLRQSMTHGHTLDIGDIDGDGHLDIFAAEMAKWSNRPEPDHPRAQSWILFGDGKGNFRKTVFTTGHGWHEGRLADLDGDGDLDILNKPYTWNAPRVDVWLNNGTARKKRR